MARRSLNQPQVTKNIGAAPPTKNRYDENGVKIVEKVNPIPLNRKMVHPNGGTMRLSLATGYSIRGGPKHGWKDNPYGSQKWIEKLQAGFAPYNECPLHPQSAVQMHVPDMFPRKKGNKPCEGTFDEEHCCEHIERMIKARQEKQTKHNAEFASSFATTQDKMVEAFQSAVNVAGKTAAAAAEPTPPAKGRNVLG